MIWLTWRQFRIQGAVVGAALAVVAVVLAATGAGLADLWETNEAAFFQAFTSDGARTTAYYAGYFAVVCVPAIVGVFWGAPLVARELETGTHRLVWSQSVTRTRWLAAKLGFTGAVAMALTALLSLLVTWWCGPIDTAINDGLGTDGFFGISRVAPEAFLARGIAPIGYTAFAFALGVVAGLLIRRTVPAMAVTLAVFVLVQIAFPTWVRPHLGPDRLTTEISASNLRGLMIEGGPGNPGPVSAIEVGIDRPGAWIVANETLDASGQTVSTLPSWVERCAPEPSPNGGSDAAAACFARLTESGYRQRVTYQPASRYWTLQAIEMAIFTALALLLAGFSLWWLRHRLT